MRLIACIALLGTAAPCCAIAQEAAPPVDPAISRVDDTVPSPEIVRPSETAPPSKSSGLDLGVAIRGRVDVRFNDARPSGQRYTSAHLSFDTVILTANYDSPVLFGSAEYRLYGASFIYSQKYGYDGYPGEVNFPAYAYIGAKLSPRDKITAGVLPVPFEDRYWGSSWYNTLGFVYGLEEVYDAGVSFSHTGERLSWSAGFFPTTGPAGFGRSRDSARYSVNIVKSDAEGIDAANNTERNIAAGNVQYKLSADPNASLTLSASAWFSSVHNYDTGRDGPRRAYAASLKGKLGKTNAKLLVLRQEIDPRNAGRRDFVTVGDYDSSYDIAARSTMLFGEISRTLETGRFPFKVNLYTSYARVLKDADGFADTQRINIGAYWNDKATGKIKIWTEALIGRNDPYVGAAQFGSGAAQGDDDRWKVSLLAMFGYYF